jgi:hypothetical protein
LKFIKAQRKLEGGIEKQCPKTTCGHFIYFGEFYNELTAGGRDAWQPVGIVGTHCIIILSSSRHLDSSKLQGPDICAEKEFLTCFSVLGFGSTEPFLFCLLAVRGFAHIILFRGSTNPNDIKEWFSSVIFVPRTIF